MDAKICDRCGAFYKLDDAIQLLRIHARIGNSWSFKDLCPNCYRAFIKFSEDRDSVPIKKYDIEYAIMSGFIWAGNGTNDELISPVMNAVDEVFKKAESEPYDSYAKDQE